MAAADRGSMRAVVIRDFGAEPELAELPVPEPAPAQALVRIRAAGLNPFDWKLIDGALREVVEHRFPLVLGSDGAGDVVATGADVSSLRVGDRVYGQFLRVKAGVGSFADYAVVGAAKLAVLPDEVPYDVAAALPTSGVAARQAVEAAGAGPGAVVLINGASGGVGQFAVQFAAAVGATVVATAPGELATHLHELGAADVVDFTARPVPDQMRERYPDGVHAVIDLVSAPNGPNAFADLLEPGGVLVSTNGAADEGALAVRDRRGYNLNSRVSVDDLTAIVDLARSGLLQVAIEQHVRLDDAPAAIARARAGQARGKTVIVP